MQAGRQRSSGWRRHAGDVLKNTGPGMVAGIAPGTLCPGHIHVPGAHYTISLVKECRFVVKGCRFASVREKCMCYIWVGNHHGHWYRFFIFNNRKIEVSLQIRGGTLSDGVAVGSSAV